MERGTWWATVHEVTKSWTRLGTHVFSDLYEILLGTEKQVSWTLGGYLWQERVLGWRLGLGGRRVPPWDP